MVMDTSLRLKRARSISESSSSSASSSGSGTSERNYSQSPSPPPKYHRAPSPTSKPYICVLPPTCSQPTTSTSYATQSELDRHQETFHKWICHVPVRDRHGENEGQGSPLRNGKGKGKETSGSYPSPDDGRMQVPESFASGKLHGRRMRECSKVFPDERLLSLHHTEVHDPIARQRKENGGKIFECFLPPSQCDRKFLDPRKRRNHLIDKHRYPQQYFFGITNHGLNEIVKQDGLAISMIRPRRDPVQPITEASEPTDQEIHNSMRSTTGAQERRFDTYTQPEELDEDESQHPPEVDMDMNDLTSKMGKMESSLSFVPRGVRKAAQAKTKGGMDVERAGV